MRKVIHKLANLHAIEYTKQQVRWKTIRFKPKIAKIKPIKTPSMLAMDHCDFYYGPMFGSRWPSIRLGLLTPGKYVAVLNTFSKDCDRHDELLEHMNTIELLRSICGRTPLERINEKKERIDTKAREETELFMKSMEVTEPEMPNYDEKPIMRSEVGLAKFQLPSHTSSLGDLHMKNKKNDDLENFQLTGFESEGLEMTRRNHFIYYPRELRLRSFPRGIISSYPPPFRDQNGIPSWWLLDGGSLVPVLALGLEKGDSLLDVCAAPGGKSLLSLLTKLPSKVVCNDCKLARLGMLKRALSTYVPTDSPVSDTVIIKRSDASNLATWNEINVYDKVLADVPCSTDRLALTQDEGNMFSVKMSAERLNLPQLQAKILINSLRSVKVGGSVVYSTCTLSSVQNEAVVENAVAVAEQKFGIRVIEESLSQLVTHLSSTSLYRFSDQCRTGILLLPYLPSNFGPTYVCKLTKVV